MRISDWSSDVCSSDLQFARHEQAPLLHAAARITETDEMTPQARRQLINFVAQMRGLQAKANTLAHPELTQLILDESGYTAMLQADRSVEAAGRLENLSELVRAMEEYETPEAFPQHVSLLKIRK